MRKDLQHFKDEVAKAYSYDSWGHLRSSHCMTYGKGDVYMNKAAERYAQYLAGEAYIKGYDDGKIGYYNNPYKQNDV